MRRNRAAEAPEVPGLRYRQFGGQLNDYLDIDAVYVPLIDQYQELNTTQLSIDLTRATRIAKHTLPKSLTHNYHV